MDDRTVIRFPNDNTVIKPRPGGKRQLVSNDRTQINFRNNQSVLSQPSANKPVVRTNHVNLSRNNMVDYPRLTISENEDKPYSESLSNNGLNELVHCASTLLSLMIKLSNSVMHKDVAQLKYKLQDELKHFEINAGRAGIANARILQARYVLCTSLDEIVAGTPWGQDGDWSQQSLLSLFHGETWGGEKFYLLLERLLKEPVKNLDILELMYICISLGFQGKYRVIDNGHEQVEQLREDLYRQLRGLRQDFNKELSSNWRGISDRRGALIRYVPLWVVGALSGVILLAMFSSFTYMLDKSSKPVINEIIKLGPDSMQTGGIPVKFDANTERLVRPPQRIPQKAQPSSDTGSFMLPKHHTIVSHTASIILPMVWRSV